VASKKVQTQVETENRLHGQDITHLERVFCQLLNWKCRELKLACG